MNWVMVLLCTITVVCFLMCVIGWMAIELQANTIAVMEKWIKEIAEKHNNLAIAHQKTKLEAYDVLTGLSKLLQKTYGVGQEETRQ